MAHIASASLEPRVTTPAKGGGHATSLCRGCYVSRCGRSLRCAAAADQRVRAPDAHGVECLLGLRALADQRFSYLEVQWETHSLLPRLRAPAGSGRVTASTLNTNSTAQVRQVQIIQTHLPATTARLPFARVRPARRAAPGLLLPRDSTRALPRRQATCRRHSDATGRGWWRTASV